MTLPVQFVFSDGHCRTLQVDEGASILGASRDAGLALLVDCRQGGCGTCQARLSTGRVDMDEYTEGVLSDAEARDGMILVCRARASGPAVIELPYSSSDALAAQDEVPSRATVLGVEKIAMDTVALNLAVGQKLHYLPGQYVNIAPDASFERSFSMAAAPGSNELRFAIAVRPDGRFARWLDRARPGEEVQLSPARGTFFLRGDARPKVMIAGGTGLAPFLAMLEALANGPHEQRSAPVQLLLGARSDAHLFGLATLEQLRERLPGMRVFIACDEVSEGSRVRKGRVTDLLQDIDIDRTATIYACGPPPMVEAARQAMRQRRMPPRQFLAEKFTG
jgi:benzoate/toluate 1,2-dioxygenase reductase subunit